MPLEPLKTWQQTLNDVVLVKDDSWAHNLSEWVDQRVTAKLQLKLIMGPVSFTFQKGLFEQNLRTMPPVADTSWTQKFAEAWAAAMNASQMMVMPGAFLGAPTPVTTWAVATTVIDGGSIQAGKARLLQELTQAKAVKDATESQISEALRDAFLAITCTVTGIYLNIPPGPLVAPLMPTV